MSRKIVSFRLVMFRDGYFRPLFGFGRMLNSRSKGVIFSSSIAADAARQTCWLLHSDVRASPTTSADEMWPIVRCDLKILYKTMWGYKTVLTKRIAKVLCFFLLAGFHPFSNSASPAQGSRGCWIPSQLSRGVTAGLKPGQVAELIARPLIMRFH